jgi:hypothetical protein
MASRRRLLLGVGWFRTKIAAALACYLTCTLLLAGTGYALDQNKRLTQYMHTSWRIQDGSRAAGQRGGNASAFRCRLEEIATPSGLRRPPECAAQGEV